MFISILIFNFSKFLSFILFGQIWSQNLKFSKLTEIWYRGTLLSAYYDFYYNVYFFKGFFIHVILGKFGKFQNIMGKFHSILFSPYWRNYIMSLCLTSVNMENNRFWDEIFPRNLWTANTSKNYSSKP